MVILALLGVYFKVALSSNIFAEKLPPYFRKRDALASAEIRKPLTLHDKDTQRRTKLVSCFRRAQPAPITII